MATHEKIRELTNFQYWLGSNYNTLTTGSVDMTERAIKYLEYLEGEKLLTVKYLLEIHPELTKEQASDLLKFSIDRTIRLKACYGNGSIIFPKWLDKK